LPRPSPSPPSFSPACPASAALAQDGWYEPAYQGADYARPIPIDRALAERCGFYAGAVRPHEMGPYRAAYRRDDGLGGALIGGAVGGLVGNRIAGRGDRTIGTVAGAAVGAIAGSAIDRAEDRGRTPYDTEPGAAYYGNECDAAFPPAIASSRCPASPTAATKSSPARMGTRDRDGPRHAPPRRAFARQADQVAPSEVEPIRRT
jgi:hypothetical protein